MSKVQLFIEGPNAEKAAKALFRIKEISGVWRPDGQVRESLDEGAIATVIAIADKPAVVIASIHQWFEDCRGSEEARVARVFVAGPDQPRRDLTEAGEKALEALFEPLAK